ncbi:MAG TPA: glycogen/starch/alpha-glucan phosphorylase [Longimicrobium sp.]|jgi:starch phosphorylase|uniref:glycogen/starch/alpha-glucan phosphorylase n=1 Tax=Longimicrobium sp. TaxID=2029185 RepID=UPI002EDAFD59
MQTIDAGRRATRVETLKHAIESHVRQTLARESAAATPRDIYISTAMAVRDKLAERWASTNARYQHRDVKRVYYLSLEFLIGKSLHNAITNLGLDGATAEALEELGHKLDTVRDLEPDAGLGNGGLGRLAACYLDSMATLELPGTGYGIRYEHGIFRQGIDDQARQIEKPDNWLHDVNPWEIARPDRTFKVKFNGRVQPRTDDEGRIHFDWVDTSDVLAMAYDTPVPGYCNNTVNTLRLWAAKATEEFDLEGFIRGNYIAAVQAKTDTETISKVLYPPDDTGAGKELRLKQQYFFVSATLQDIIRRYKTERTTFADFADKVQIQLNDTHPAVAIPELMRLLMDEHGLEWDASFDIARRTYAYTNHTVLPEALEEWSLELFGRLLPRHLELVREIDRRFRARVKEKFPGDAAREERMAIIAGGKVRMAHLAIVGSHSTNGVAALHSQILKDRIFRDFNELWPERLTNVTNGVTQRRWMLKSNPGLSAIITEAIGPEWITNLEQLAGLEAFADDAAFRAQWRKAKAENRRQLAKLVRAEAGVSVDPRSLMDVQVKRMHEYKRQLLNALRCVDTLLQLRDTPDLALPQRAVLFGGKAAPTYWTAKLIIQLIGRIAREVNEDPVAGNLLRVAFIPDYRVSLAERIFPGSDLSEQISTAGFEASGTGNMKFALNGALTIGTMDGANVEIAEHVGEENMFIFGLRAEEVEARRKAGYNPRAEYEASPRLRRVLDFVASGTLSPEDPGLFRPLIESLLHHDPYMLLADFDAYLDAQALVDAGWGDQEEWTRKAILNVARCGWFSSDRSVREYAERIWKVPVP